MTTATARQCLSLSALAAELRTVWMPKTHPGRSRGMFVLVQDSSKAIVSSDVEPGYLVRIGDRCGQRILAVVAEGIHGATWKA
jgi:hypothetical protein